MEKIRTNKNVFVSRPMHGVTRAEDNELLFDIRQALKNAHMLKMNENYRIMNSWEGPAVPIKLADTEAARVWRLGHAISEMADADIVIFVKDCWKNAKGCAVEYETYRKYCNLMAEKWGEALIYNPKENTLRRLSDVKGSGKNKCTDDIANLITDLANHGYPNELIEDAVNLSKKIIDVGRTNM